MKKFSNEWHIEKGLRDGWDEPMEYSLSGIIHSLKHRHTSGTETSLDMGHWVTARSIPASTNILQRLKFAWMVIKGEVSILHYR